MRTFFRNHGLSIVMGLFFLVFLVGQTLSGRHEYNEERKKHGQPELGMTEYLRSAHFIEATSENWESEFLQMFVYVFATAFLFQKGSAESNDPRKRRSGQKAKTVSRNSPWPVRHGGWVLRVYKHSLSLAFLTLFIFAAALHVYGGHKLYNEEQLAERAEPVSLSGYLTSSRFWFESFQNWQSEFLAIGSMVLLSIWLRETNSPESKDVETPHWENEE